VALFIYEKDVERLVSVADAMPAIAEVFRLSGADETKKRKKTISTSFAKSSMSERKCPSSAPTISALPRGRTAN
jgi:hypothetical protein